MYNNTCTVTGCDSPIEALNMCVMHCGEWFHKSTKVDYSPRSGWFIDADSRADIYERDEWVCQLCHEPVDPDHPERRHQASLDHIIPQSYGGGHDPSNLRLAHISCNSRRGNRDYQPDPADTNARAGSIQADATCTCQRRYLTATELTAWWSERLAPPTAGSHCAETSAGNSALV